MTKITFNCKQKVKRCMQIKHISLFVIKTLVNNYVLLLFIRKNLWPLMALGMRLLILNDLRSNLSRQIVCAMLHLKTNKSSLYGEQNVPTGHTFAPANVYQIIAGRRGSSIIYISYFLSATKI